MRSSFDCGILVFVIFVIILGIFIIIVNLYNNGMKDKCIKNGGKAITNEYGRFDRCVMGEDNNE